MKHPDDQSSQNVYQCDNDPRDSVSAHKFTGSIHCTIEVGLFLDLSSSISGLGLGNESCIQVSVDAHLFSWHRIKGKPCSHLGDPPSPLGDDHKVDDDQDREDDQPNDGISSHDEGTKGFNDITRSGRSLVSMEQDQSG